MTAEYEALAEVYEWLVPDSLLEPEGAVAAFAHVLGVVPVGGLVLDCAAGIPSRRCGHSCGQVVSSP
jgi:hypothetical protein